MLQVMAKKRGNILYAKRYVRTHDRSRDALADLLHLAGKQGLRFEDKPVSQEAFVNAAWIYLLRSGVDWKAVRSILAEMDSWPMDSEAPLLTEGSSVVDAGDPAEGDDGPLYGNEKPASKGRRKP